MASFDGMKQVDPKPRVREQGGSGKWAAYPGIRDNGTQLIGPTRESAGRYPRVDGDLRLDTPAWMAGGTCGPFCGTVAAMISGRHAADSALVEREAMR